jgi:cation transport protein ChaC
VYHIPDRLAKEVWAYLDHREKDGYSLRTVDVYGIDPHTGEEVILHTGVRPVVPLVDSTLSVLTERREC